MVFELFAARPSELQNRGPCNRLEWKQKPAPQTRDANQTQTEQSWRRRGVKQLAINLGNTFNLDTG